MRMVRIVFSLFFIVTIGLFNKSVFATDIPQTSNYPAEIGGHVIIAETINVKYQSGDHTGETMEMTPLKGQVYWIVDVLVVNKSYDAEIIASSTDWKIIAGDNEYGVGRGFMGIKFSVAMTAPVGGNGKTTFLFSIPDTLEVSEARLCYQGQEPYSYGELTGGDKVVVYDWDLKKVLVEKTGLSSASPMIMRQIACLAESSDKISIVLEPTNDAVAYLTYKVDVMKGEMFRATASVSWNQTELQAKQMKVFKFPTTSEEFQFYTADRNQGGYIWKNLSKEFTVIAYTNTTSHTIKYVPGSSSGFRWWYIVAPILIIGVIFIGLFIRKSGGGGTSELGTKENPIHVKIVK
jgi:hypothetical protein